MHKLKEKRNEEDHSGVSVGDKTSDKLTSDLICKNNFPPEKIDLINF